MLSTSLVLFPDIMPTDLWITQDDQVYPARCVGCQNQVVNNIVRHPYDEGSSVYRR